MSGTRTLRSQPGRARLAAALGPAGAVAALTVFAAVFAPRAHAAEPTAPAGGEWKFRALLDGKPIGEHRFSVVARGNERKVRSEARFNVKVLGLSAYRYHHHANEQWRGDCLTALASNTDDDGTASSVRTEAAGEVAAPPAGDAAVLPAPPRGGEAVVPSLAGCVMSFAYWNPAIRTQTRLLNAQTGKLEAVQVARIGTGSVEVRGRTTAATQFRITGPARPIDVWYSAEGEWIGLDSVVGGGRTLSYRLE